MKLTDTEWDDFAEAHGHIGYWSDGQFHEVDSPAIRGYLDKIRAGAGLTPVVWVYEPRSES